MTRLRPRFSTVTHRCRGVELAAHAQTALPFERTHPSSSTPVERHVGILEAPANKRLFSPRRGVDHPIETRRERCYARHLRDDLRPRREGGADDRTDRRRALGCAHDAAARDPRRASSSGGSRTPNPSRCRTAPSTSPSRTTSRGSGSRGISAMRSRMRRRTRSGASSPSRSRSRTGTWSRRARRRHPFHRPPSEPSRATAPIATLRRS